MKLAPSAGATGQATTLTLSWNGSSGATAYEWCVLPATVQCGEWTDIGQVTSKLVTGLPGNTVYQWQVRARNAYGVVEADAGNWWTFRTGQ